MASEARTRWATEKSALPRAQTCFNYLFPPVYELGNQLRDLMHSFECTQATNATETLKGFREMMQRRIS